MPLPRNLLLFALLLAPASLFGTTIDFEGLSDGAFLTTEISGVTFTNAQVLSAGISLNEFEFPPHSGVNVVSDSSGPLSVTFDKPIALVSGYFTYLAPLTIKAYGSSLDLLGTVTSAFSDNLALSGDAGSSPNEFLSLMSPVDNISTVTFTALAGGSSFVLDDLSYATSAISPEPGTLSLVALSAVAVFARTRHRR